MNADSDSLLDDATRLVLEGQFSEAELMLRQAVELAGDDAELYVAALATLLGLQEGRDEEANEILLAEMGNHPDSPNLLVAYGLTARQSGESEAAADAFQKALEMNPNHPMALHSMAKVLLDKGKIGEAEKMACRAFSLVPDHADFALTAIELLELRGENEMAYDVATLGASFNPDEIELVQKSVEGALARQEPEVAWDTLECSKDEYPWVLGWRATLLEYAGKTQEADAMLDLAREKFGDHPELLFLEAAICHRRGDFDATDELLDLVLLADPTHKGAIQLKENIGQPIRTASEVLDEEQLMAVFYTHQRYRECLETARELRLREASPEATTFECLSLASLGETEAALALCSKVPVSQVQAAIDVLTTHGRGTPGEEIVRDRLKEYVPPEPVRQALPTRHIDLNTSDYDEAEEEEYEDEEEDDDEEYEWVEVDEDDDDPDAEYEDD